MVVVVTGVIAVVVGTVVVVTAEAGVMIRARKASVCASDARRARDVFGRSWQQCKVFF